MIWPVPLRGSMRSTATASSRVATSLSMPNSAMCTGGSVVVRSALPSLVTSTMVPVSAMAMFAPEMPTVASMNFLRSDARAWLWIASTVGSVPNTLAASSLVRWIAGAMRWEGCVWVSCTMRSPRSVSTTSMPRFSRYGLSSISSPAIDLTLVTTMRPAGNPLTPAESIAARAHSWPMISRASAASLAKWTTPPTAASRSVNCSSSSGRRSRLARRRCFRSARPFVKSKLSNALSRRPRSPVIALVSAFCRVGSSSALLTRRPKWPRDSGTRFRNFLDRVLEGFRCEHRRQAYGSGAHHRTLIPTRIDHGVRVGRPPRAGELRILGGHFDRMRHAVQRAGEDRRHQAVLPGQGGHRFEGAARTFAKRSSRVTPEDVELDQRHCRDGILGQRLDPLAEASELVSTRAVEVAPQLGVPIPFFYVRGEVERDLHPPVSKPVLIRAHRREQGPDLVAELAVRTFGVRHSLATPVGALEKRFDELRRELLLPRVEVGDRQRSVPRRVYAPVHVRRLALLALLCVHRVVVLVGVLASRVKPALGLA